MEAEIARIQNIYQTNLQRLEQYVSNLKSRVRSWRIPQYVRNYYLRYIQRWYQNEKQRLEKMRDEALAVIYQRYNKPADRRKQACLVGINYVGTQYALNGCVNDVVKFRELLITKYGYDPKDIRILANEQATRTNILTEFTRLVQNAVSGDSICFSFSGHGVYVKDRNGDEKDNQDELIVSADFYGILDDEFKAILNKYLKEGVKLFALFDNCHSGTILDLRYQHMKTGEPVLKVHDTHNETTGQVVCISGCRDDQVSMDAYLDGKYNGAMTWALVETLSSNSDLTWKDGLVKLREKLTTRGFVQRPQLTTGRSLVIDQDKISL